MCRCVLVLGVEAPKKSTDANIFGHVVDRDHRRDGHGIRYHDRRFGALFPEKPARGRADARSPRVGLCLADAAGDASTRTDGRTEFRGGAERHLDGRGGRVGQPFRPAAPGGACSGERAGRRVVREDQRLVPGTGAVVPARRACRGRLPELRLHAGAHQRSRRPLFADPGRFAPGILGPDGRIRPGADPGQHDRACRSAARRRFGAVRVVGHRRHDQRHYEGAFAQFGADVAYAHFDRRQQFL